MPLNESINDWNAPLEDADLYGRAVIYDTTLRDGEQHAGVTFSKEEKVAIGRKMDAMGIPKIETAIPAVSKDDQEATEQLADELSAEVWVASRALRSDVDLAARLGVSGIAVICLAGDHHLSTFRWTLSDVIGLVGDAVHRARELGLTTSVLLADASRMQPDRLEDIITQVDARATPSAYALMDTFGVLTPVATDRLVRAVKGMTEGPIEFHGHNDFGLAVANSFAAVAAGCQTVHTAMHGLGERVGNTPLEEYVMATEVLYNARTTVSTMELTELSALVSEASGITPPSNKPIVGNFNRIETGVVVTEYVRTVLQRGMGLEWLFPFAPETVGKPPVEIVLGKASGASNVTYVLQERGIEPTPDVTRELVDWVKTLGIQRKGLVSPEELVERYHEVTA